CPHCTEDHDELCELRNLVPVWGDKSHCSKADQHRTENGENGRHAPSGRSVRCRCEYRFRIGRRDPATFDPEIDIGFQFSEIGALPHEVSRFFVSSAGLRAENWDSTKAEKTIDTSQALSKQGKDQQWKMLIPAFCTYPCLVRRNVA